MGGHETYAPFFDLDMAKYIDAEKLAKAIEDKGLNCSFALKIERLDTLALIDELQQEQPEVDLEKEMKEYFKGWTETEEGIACHYQYVDLNTCHGIARHFYELGLIERGNE